MLRRWAIVTMIAGLSAAAVGPAATAAEPECGEGYVWDRVTQTCVLKVESPGDDGDPATTPDPGAEPVKDSAPKCEDENGEVPCRDGNAWWSNDRQCYVEIFDPQPPKGSEEWEGHDTGAVYNCYVPGADFGYSFWSETPPPGVGAPPDPRVLVQEAIAVMQLRAIDIGIVPEDGLDRVGLVGMPVWMWVQNPTQNTWGPITRTASAEGYTLSATAHVKRVAWTMGDGETVRCGRGTEYEDRFGTASSPTCGHTYVKPGKYTVTAESDWVVDWAGVGQTGSINLQVSRDAQLTIGEAQVLIQ